MATRAETPDTTTKKRPRGSPTFRTPVRPAKRERVPMRQSPAPEHPVSRLSRSFTDGKSWDDDECHALVEFLLLMSGDNKWPEHKRMNFWEHAGKFMQQRTKSRHLRTGEYS